MRTNQSNVEMAREIAAKAEKKSYVQPTLRVYGTVAEFTKGSQTTGSDGGSSTRRNTSSASYKENLVRIGNHSLGFGIYLFDYKSEFRAAFGVGRQFGVLAEEVAKVVPEAVARDADGYITVDYTLLGITRH